MAGKKRNRALHLARQESAKAGATIRLDIDPVDALQEVLDSGVAALRYATERVNELTEDDLTVMTAFGPIDNRWITVETERRLEVGNLAARMVQIGIADRAVRVQEAKAALLVQAITAAAREAGIPRDKVRKLGPALRTQLAALEGGGEGDGAPAARGRVRVA